jgi:hypothetical protein
MRSMNDSVSVEPMVIEMKELGTEGLNVVVYDVRSDDDATFLAATSGHDLDEDSPRWRDLAPEEVNTEALVQYIDHEWRNATVEYAEDGLIKTGPQMDRVTGTILVSQPETLVARIERLDGCYIISVEADGYPRFEWDVTDEELGLETHPALVD